jgi:hypothetical protein
MQSLMHRVDLLEKESRVEGPNLRLLYGGHGRLDG